MTIHFIIQVPQEEPAGILKWALQKGHHCTFTRIYKDDVFPDVDNIDGLVIMGGPVRVYEEEKYPWLIEEKRFLKKCIEKKILMMGVCLGSQLLAEALGAKTYRNSNKEIGWFEVSIVEENIQGTPLSGLPKNYITFHWHEDTFDLPKGAKWLAKSECTRHQAFLYESHILGIQYHMEFDESTLFEMVNQYPEDFEGGRFVQTQNEALTGIKNVPQNMEYLKKVLNNFFKD